MIASRWTFRRAGASHFIYDASGRVMGEYGASISDVQAEFIWVAPQVGQASPFGGDDGVGGYAPLAVATPDGTGTVVLNWVHGNHLGVPIVATNSVGSASTTPDDYLLPGFPGQSRVFADLYYNRYRDYDPVTGRYIQADPIGLDGDPNPYLYAGANPVNYVDPDGKIAFLAPVGRAAAGAIFSGGIQAVKLYLAGCDITDWGNYDKASIIAAAGLGVFWPGPAGGVVKAYKRYKPYKGLSRADRGMNRDSLSRAHKVTKRDAAEQAARGAIAAAVTEALRGAMTNE